MTADLARRLDQAQRPEFTVAFRAQSYLPDVWYATHTTDDPAEADRMLDELVAADVRDGAPVGCEWRVTLTLPRSATEQSVRRVVMTADGPQEQAA